MISKNKGVEKFEKVVEHSNDFTLNEVVTLSWILSIGISFFSSAVSVSVIKNADLFLNIFLYQLFAWFVVIFLFGLLFYFDNREVYWRKIK
jgi:hypothetical protein